MHAPPRSQSRPESAGPRRLLGLWPWLPLPLALVYLVVLATKFSALVGATNLNADAASAPVIGELYGGSPAHRQVFLGQMGWFSTLLMELATRWLPLHRQLWEAAPYAMALAAVALMSWAAWRIAGRWAASITAVLLICAAPQTLALLFSLNDHSPTWFSLALLGALVVLLERPPAWLSAWVLAALALVIGAVVGANAASDPIVLVAGIVPVLLSAAGVWLLSPGRERARAGLWLLGIMLVAGAFDIATKAWAKNQNVLVPSGLVHNQLASAEALSGNFKLWWQSLMVLGNGNFFGQTLGFTSGLQLICAVLAVIAVLLIPWIAWRVIVPRAERLRPHAAGGSPAPAANASPADAAGASPAHPASGSPATASPALLAWCLFWASSAVLLSASFVFSSNPVNIGSARYLVGAVYAAAAIVPLAALGRPAPLRVAITVAATVFALTGLVSLLKNEPTEAAGGNSSDALYSQVAAIAAREHLSVGYADYWDAAPITLYTHYHLRTYPVQDCLPNLCWSYLHMITSWYTTPRPRTRTFLISDSAKPSPASASPVLGAPSSVHAIGPLTMYVYPYDIATRMKP